MKAEIEKERRELKEKAKALEIEKDAVRIKTIALSDGWTELERAIRRQEHDLLMCAMKRRKTK